jgi:copper chaperone CopZ
MINKPARVLTFKCDHCAKAVKVFLQKVSACSHIQPYQGLCDCGQLKRHATGNKDAVASFLASTDGNWSHRH